MPILKKYYIDGYEEAIVPLSGYVVAESEEEAIEMAVNGEWTECESDWSSIESVQMVQDEQAYTVTDVDDYEETDNG